jgi:ubiquinone/menaquinone biosynthesis C-methylase UbiE
MKAIRREREKIVPEAEGRVLEIGFGSGHNAPFYDCEAITHLYALEPSAGWRRLGEKRLRDLPFTAEWVDLPGEEIPLANESVDTVLVTFSLWSISGVAAALAGMRRVLKPGGKLVFLEHGAAPDPGVAKWQDRLNGVWGKFAGGCNLNRNPDDLIGAADFRIERIDRHYAPGAPKIAGFVSAGVASR